MFLPVIRGLIERRILVNYRATPEVIARQLPAPFRPQLVSGWAMAGICLIRLREVRPAGIPGWLGIGSENAAHRIAVEWDAGGEVRSGVYVRRRDTDSWINSLAGGRVFPGIHSHATFSVEESPTDLSVAFRSDDGLTSADFRGRPTTAWPATSVFRNLEEASAFFEAGSLGYSATPDPAHHEGLELRCREWRAEPLAMDEVHSSLFDDATLFPRGSIEFDCALLMRNIEHEWHGLPPLGLAAAGAA